jgi:hypothetical protein
MNYYRSVICAIGTIFLLLANQVSGSIRINELHYNPADSVDTTEFIEFLNTADKVLAHTTLDVILDRQELSDDEPETTSIQLLSRQ